MTTEPIKPDSVIAPGEEYQYFEGDVPIGVPIDLESYGVRMRVSGPIRGDHAAIAAAFAQDATRAIEDGTL